jgi:hypothetical protein
MNANTDIIRIADARNVIENAINICFGRYYDFDEYLFEGALITKYEVVKGGAYGDIKLRTTDADVQLMLDGHLIFHWNPVRVSDVNTDKIAGHLKGWSLIDHYIEFFQTAKRLCEEFNKKKTC